MKQLDITIHDKLYPELDTRWQDLWDRSDNATAFNSPAWFRAVIEAEDLKELRIIACSRDEQLVAVLPLVRSRRFAVPVWTNPGDKFFTEKSALLVQDWDPETLHLVFQTLIKQGNVHVFEVDRHIVEQLVQDFPRILASVSSVSPYLHLHLYPFRDVSGKVRSKMRNKIAKHLKSLRYAHYRDNLDERFAEIVDLESRSRKRLQGKTVFNKPQGTKLFLSLIRHCKEFVAIDMIYHNHKPFVYNLGVSWKNTYLTYQTAFLDEYRSLSPGKMLLCYLVTKLNKDGVWICDLARGFNQLKQEFTRDYVLQYDIWYSRNPLIRAWWLLINEVRRSRQRLIRSGNSSDHRFLFRRLRLRHQIDLRSQALSI